MAVHLNVADALLLCGLLAAKVEILFQQQFKDSFCYNGDSKELGCRLAAPNVLGGVNGLCNLYKQVSGGCGVSLGDVISQGSSVTREGN